jgi:hypothetical protein
MAASALPSAASSTAVATTLVFARITEGCVLRWKLDPSMHPLSHLLPHIKDSMHEF